MTYFIKHMTFNQFAKNVKKSLVQKYAVHNRLSKQIEVLYRQVLPHVGQDRRDRVDALHVETSQQINATKLKLQKELNDQFEAQKDKIELDYMRKEIVMLQLWKDNIEGRKLLLNKKLK